jgi:ABC-type nitrate/sulfonate/bicarbonate transport system permease component
VSRAAAAAAARRLQRWIVLTTAALAWQAWASSRKSLFFPPLSAIAARMYHLWFSGAAAHLWLTPAATGNILPSLVRVAAGLGIAAVAGGASGIAIGRSPALRDYLDPILQFGRSLPAVALVTAFIAVFRLGSQMEIAFIAFGSLWPVLLNTIDGARTADPVQEETARAFRLTAAQRLAWLIVPAAAPKFFTGLRISVSLALVLMVIAELTGASNGIGYQMTNAAAAFDLTGLWAGIVLLAILGYALNTAVLAAEHHLLGWHHATRSHAM